jgi:hypothetical protein
MKKIKLKHTTQGRSAVRSDGFWNSKDALRASSVEATKIDDVMMQISLVTAAPASQLGWAAVLNSRPAPIFICEPSTMRQQAAFSL